LKLLPDGWKSHLLNNKHLAVLARNEAGRKSGMSRSAFASHFQAVTGITPMQYVTNWRIQTAFEKLRTGKDSVGLIAEQSS